jgi:hypothetical protein
MANGIWYPAYSLDRLLAVAVPSERRATGLTVALALLLAFVTMGLRRKAPEDPGPAERRAMAVAGRCVPRPPCVLTVLSVRVSSSRDAFRGGVVTEFYTATPILFSTSVTPGADHAACAASSWSAQEPTLPRRITL